MQNVKYILHKKVSIEMFSIDVHIFVGQIEHVSKYFLKKYIVSENIKNTIEDMDYVGLTFIADNGLIIFVNDKNDSALMAHEAIHGSWKALVDGRGCMFDSNNDELQAYFVGYLVSEFVDKKNWNKIKI